MTQPLYNYGNDPSTYDPYAPSGPPAVAGDIGSIQGNYPSNQANPSGARQGGYGGFGGLYGGQTNVPGTSDAYYTPQREFTSDDPHFNYGGFDWGQQYYQNRYQGLAEGARGQIEKPSADMSQAMQDYQAGYGARGELGGVGQRMQGMEGQLQAEASGKGTTAADYAFQQGLDKSIAAQQAMANSARGGPSQAAAAARTAAGTSSAMQQQGAGQLGMQKFAEQRSAQQQLQDLYGAEAGLYGGMRGQDISQQGMSQQQVMDQAQIQAQYNQLQAGREQEYTGAEQNVNQQQLAAYAAQQEAQQQYNAMQYATQAGQQQAYVGAGTGAFGSGLSSLARSGGDGNSGTSDINAKTSIQPQGAGGFGTYAGQNPSMVTSQAPPSPWQPSAPGVYGQQSPSMQAGMAPEGGPPMGGGAGPGKMGEQVASEAMGHAPGMALGRMPMGAEAGTAPAGGMRPAGIEARGPLPPAMVGAPAPPRPQATAVRPTPGGGQPGPQPVGGAPVPPRPTAAGPGGPGYRPPQIPSDREAKEQATRQGFEMGAHAATRHLVQSHPPAGVPFKPGGGAAPPARSIYYQDQPPPVGLASGGPGRLARPMMPSAPPGGQAYVGRGPIAAPSLALSPPPNAVASDEAQKSFGRNDVADQFLDAASRSASTYHYKDMYDEPTDRPTGGKYLGVMAQSLERVPEVGRQIVKDGPRGKYLEGGPSLSAALAGLGRLHERLKRVEGRGR